MNWAFISIPKTGTNSIHQALNTNKKDNHKAIGLVECDYSFAFIRHPLDRLVSWYFGHRATNPSLVQYQGSFREWVAKGCPHHWTEDNLKQFGVSNPLNQWEFIEVNGSIKVDLLGKFENINEDFKSICEVIGVQAELPHILKSKHAHWSIYYDIGLMKLVKNRFKKDMDLWESLSLVK